MLFADTLGIEAFRQRVKIHATDVDDEALAQARYAAYTPAEVEGLTEAQLEQYFELQGSRYCFRKDLRRSVIFGRNDLVQDAPISRIDLLVCRNRLMYFDGRDAVVPHQDLRAGGPQAAGLPQGGQRAGELPPLRFPQRPAAARPGHLRPRRTA
jgi:hypothetical protein